MPSAQRASSSSSRSSSIGQNEINKSLGSPSGSPEESAPIAIRKGLQVLSRGHRACNVCRRQKMRCEGPVNGPCNRCKNTQQECKFELPPLKSAVNSNVSKSAIAIQTSPAEIITANDDRVKRLENQVADLHSMMKEFMTSGEKRSQASESRIDPEESTNIQNEETRDSNVHHHHTIRSSSRSTANSRRSKRHIEDTGDLPEEGLEAPLKTLRGLAEAAIRRPRVDTLQQNQNDLQPRTQLTSFRAPFLVRSNSTSRAASPNNSEIRQRNRIQLNDLITKGVLSENEARRLWTIFSQGCPRFIAACFVEEDQFGLPGGHDEFDEIPDTFSLTRRTSPFLFVTILAIGAQIDSATNGIHSCYRECCQEAQMYAQRTLLQHAPQLRVEDVMALNLMASYSDYGWLLSGHAVRIAQELSLDTYFSQIMKKSNSVHHHSSSHASTINSTPSIVSNDSPTLMNNNHRRSGNGSTDEESEDEQEQFKRLVRGSRIWFFTFLLEHQISYGAGKSAMLQHHTVDGCRDFLRVHSTLVNSIDARFVATLELMVLRERHINCLAPFDLPINEIMLGNVHSLNEDLRLWLDHWTSDLLQRGYDEQSFWMASLRIQYSTAKLYLTSTSLRKAGTSHEGSCEIRWNSINAGRRDLIIQSVKAAFDALTIAVQNKEYFGLLKWAPHYTIVTVTFSAVFLLKAIRIFPVQNILPISGLNDIFHLGEMLISRFKEIPSANRFGAVVLHMLRQCYSIFCIDSVSDSNNRFNEERYMNLSRRSRGPMQDFSMNTNSNQLNDRRNLRDSWPTTYGQQQVEENSNRTVGPMPFVETTKTSNWNGFAPLPNTSFSSSGIPFAAQQNMNTFPYNAPPVPMHSQVTGSNLSQYPHNINPNPAFSSAPIGPSSILMGRNFESFDQVLRELGLDDNLVNVFDDGNISSFDSSFLHGEIGGG